MNLEFSTFKTLIEAVRDYYKQIDKLGEALGGIVLEDFYDLPSVLCNELEKATGVKWTDDVWEAIHSPKADCPIKDIWYKIDQLKENNND